MFDENLDELKTQERSKQLPRGFRKNISAAFGFSIDQSLAASTAISLNTENATPRESDVILSWGGEVIKITKGEKEGNLILRKKIDEKRSVSILMEFDEDKSSGLETRNRFTQKRASSYNVSDIVVESSETGECVSLKDWIPDGVDVSMRIFEGRKWNKSRRTKKSFTPNDDFNGGEIVFEQMDNLNDILSIPHEVEHANIISRGSEEVKNKLEVSRELHKKGGVAIEANDVSELLQIESELNMQVSEAYILVSENEHQADSLTDVFISEVSDVLKIDEADLVSDRGYREDSHLSYDKSEMGGSIVSLLFPGGCVSERARKIQSGNEKELSEHFTQTRQIIEKWEDSRGNDWVSIDTPEGTYRLNYNRSFLRMVAPVGVNGEAGEHTYDISFVSCYSKSKLKGEGAEMKLNNFEEAENTVHNIREFIPVEKKILELLNSV